MIEFHTPELNDKPWVDKLLAQGEAWGCEYSFTNLYTWQKTYQFQIAPVEGHLGVRLWGGLGHSYLYPAGSGSIEAAIAALGRDAAERGEDFRMVCLSGEQREDLERRFPGGFDFVADRDSFDYLYDIQRLADLPGKKLHNKRNHISALERQFPGWTFEEITPACLEECLRMDEEWRRRSQGREGAEGELTLDSEDAALHTAIEHFQALGLEGGLLRVYGEVVAFTIGEPLNPWCYDVRFEKAYNELRGAYPLINREFARWVRKKHPDIQFLNREDDMGVPGLRKAKESYYPDRMVENHSAIQRKPLF